MVQHPEISRIIRHAKTFKMLSIFRMLLVNGKIDSRTNASEDQRCQVHNNIALKYLLHMATHYRILHLQAHSIRDYQT